MKKANRKRSFHVIDAILIVVFLAIISFGVGLALRTVDQFVRWKSPLCGKSFPAHFGQAVF